MNAITKFLQAAPQQQQISVDQWGKFLDNPRQRDTERHAKAAAQKHLKEYNQVHAQVAAGVLPDGTIYKLDGHTRSVQTLGQPPRPDVVVGEPFDVVVERVQPPSSKDSRLAHAATESLAQHPRLRHPLG